VHHCNIWKQKTILMSLAILFHFLCAHHFSDINISIIRRLRLFCWITILVVLFLVRCVLVFRCGLGWSGVRVAGWSLKHGYHSNPTTPKHQQSNQEHATNVVIQQNSRNILMMDILMSETCWANKKWNKKASDIKLVFCFQLWMKLMYVF